jgi:hypothetical protein
MDRRWTHWLIGGCAVLFAGSSLSGQQVQFQGSVPAGAVSPTPLSLTLREVIDRGMRPNLGLPLSGQASETARGERLSSLSALLPQVTGAVSENAEQIDLKTAGSTLFFPRFLLRQSSVRSIMPMRALSPPSASSITASTRVIVVPRRASAPPNYRSRMLAIWWCSPWQTPICS